MSERVSPPEIDLADVGDLIERIAKIARANGVASVSLAHAGLSIDVSLLPTSSIVDASPPRPPETAILVTSPAAAETSELITAPMVGTYYAGSGPSEPPFVAVGQRIEIGETIAIIEAMKIMNEIPAEVAGVVVDVLVVNGQAVEYGTPLLRIAPDPEALA